MENGTRQSFSSIARELGISTAVVSNVVRNTSATTLASRSTKQKILDAVWRNGLRLNSNIGIIIPQKVRVHEALFYPGFAGMTERCAQLGFGTFQFSIDEAPAIPDFLKRRDVSGLIFWNEAPKNIYDFVLEGKIPFVFFNPQDEIPEQDAVFFSDYETMRELFQYLYKKSYRKYIFILEEEKKGYVQRIKKAFLDFLEETGCSGEFLSMKQENVLFLEQKAETADPETVFVTLSRYYTIKLLEFFTKYSKHFPEDCGLVGSNILADFYDPKLTTVINPYYECGISAVDMIAEKWSTRQFFLGRKMVLKGNIIKNHSTGGA